MPLVSAFLVPGSPLTQLKGEIPTLGRLAAAMRTAGRSLAASRPDVVLLYSTQWIAVLDQLWLTRQHNAGIHVDENWYEFGDLEYSIDVDTQLAHACVAGSPNVGVLARGVDYEGFPIDSGTIVAASLLGIGGPALPLVVGSNNLYHDGQRTEQIAAMALACADAQGKRVAVVGVGGLSGAVFRTEINLHDDKIVSPQEEDWNRRILALIESGNSEELRKVGPDFATQARADMGFKHFHWVLGAMQGTWSGAVIHGYEPIYGSGGAVIEFKL